MFSLDPAELTALAVLVGAIAKLIWAVRRKT